MVLRKKKEKKKKTGRWGKEEEEDGGSEGPMDEWPGNAALRDHAALRPGALELTSVPEAGGDGGSQLGGLSPFR